MDENERYSEFLERYKNEISKEVSVNSHAIRNPGDEWPNKRKRSSVASELNKK